MQNSAPPPQPPAPPAPETPLFPSQAQGGAPASPVIGVPRTEQEVRILRERRTEIGNQLESAVDRRNNLAEAIQEAEGANREGMIDRMRLLDRRILQLETDLAVVGQQLAAAPNGLGSERVTTASTRDPETFAGMSSGQVTALGVVFTIFVLMPLAIGMARLMWKRATAPVRAALGQDTATMQRMERMEQGIESIAIEVERVSEAQRFLTRLLTESRDVPALGVGQRPAEPVRVPQGEAVRAARES